MKPMNSRARWALLIAVMTLGLAATGVLYAHWTSTLDATVGIQTGEVGVGWWDVNCSESANPVFGVVPGPGGGDTTARPYGVPPGDEAWANLGSPFSQGGTQYTKWETNKNVAWVETAWEALLPTATINYYNTYPSYYDDCEMEFTNSGSTPIAVPYLVIEGQPGTVLASDIFAEDGHVWVEWSGQAPPTPQLDPAEVVTGSLKLHVEQVAEEDTDYSFSLVVCVHNWNEPTNVDEDVCDLYDVFDGRPVSKTTGEPVIVIPVPFG